MDKLVKIGTRLYNPRYIKFIRKAHATSWESGEPIPYPAIEISLHGEPEPHRSAYLEEATRDEAFDAIATLFDQPSPAKDAPQEDDPATHSNGLRIPQVGDICIDKSDNEQYTISQVIVRNDKLVTIVSVWGRAEYKGLDWFLSEDESLESWHEKFSTIYPHPEHMEN